MISEGTRIISSNVITFVLTASRKMIIKRDSFPLNSLKSKTLMIASKNEPFLSCNSNVRWSSKIEDSRMDHGKIGTPFVNKNILSVDENFSVQSDVNEANKLDISVQRSSTNERNTASLQIEEKFLKVSFLKSSRSQTRADR